MNRPTTLPKTFDAAENVKTQEQSCHGRIAAQLPVVPRDGRSQPTPSPVAGYLNSCKVSKRDTKKVNLPELLYMEESH